MLCEIMYDQCLNLQSETSTEFQIFQETQRNLSQQFLPCKTKIVYDLAPDMSFSEQLHGYFVHESTQRRMTRLTSYALFLMIAAAKEGD